MRPILLGMCDPSGTEPLGIDGVPRGAAGYRLWQISGLTREEWLAAFERRNLLPGTKWSRFEAMAIAVDLRQSLFARTVVVLGDQVWQAMRFRSDRPIIGKFLLLDDMNRYYYIPHPSGLSRAYNDELTRLRTKRLLRRLAK